MKTAQKNQHLIRSRPHNEKEKERKQGEREREKEKEKESHLSIWSNDKAYFTAIYGMCCVCSVCYVRKKTEERITTH